MTPVAAALVYGTGGALLASGAVDALDALRIGTPGRRAVMASGPGHTVRGPTRALGAAVRGLCVRYGGSARGRRLAARLDAASIDAGPAQWRLGQAGAALAVAGLMYLSTGSPIWAGSVALSGVRTAGRLVLRGRRGRRDEELCMVAVVLARHLATELGSGATLPEACRSLAVSEEARGSRRLRALMASLDARTAVGEGPTLALHRAVDELPAGPGRDVLAVLATDLELVVDRGAGTPVLSRLASGIEERRQTIAEVRAATAEIRTASLAIPSMALVFALVLVGVDPAIAAAALSPLGAAVGLVLGALAAAGTLLARRATRPPELA